MSGSIETPASLGSVMARDSATTGGERAAAPVSASAHGARGIRRASRQRGQTELAFERKEVVLGALDVRDRRRGPTEIPTPIAGLLFVDAPHDEDIDAEPDQPQHQRRRA